MKRVLKEEILNLRLQGKKYKDIRKELGCTMSVISYHCKNANMSVGHNKPTQEEIDLANKLYLEGNNLKTVAKAVNRTRNCIKLYLKNYDGKKYLKYISKSQSVVKWRKRKKIELVNYKGGKCNICGYDKCIEALAFHHLDPLEKDFTIGGKSWGFEKLKLEADKCILLCSNCHIEVHQKLHIDKGL